MSGPITQDCKRRDRISHAWSASLSTLDADQCHQLNRTFPQAEGQGQLWTRLRCAPAGWAGGGQGAIPSPQRYPERMGEIRNNQGEKGEEEDLERELWVSPGMEIPTWEPSPMGDASLLFPMLHR